MQNGTLPETFRPLLWSYDFSRIDPLKHKKTIIVQAVNYGTLAHWRWLVQSYGREGVRDVVTRCKRNQTAFAPPCLVDIWGRTLPSAVRGSERKTSSSAAPTTSANSFTRDTVVGQSRFEGVYQVYTNWAGQRPFS